MRRLQAVGTGVGDACIRLSTSRTETDASPERRQRGAHAGAFDRGREVLGEPRGKLHHVGLDLARAQAAVDQTEKPLGEVAIKGGTLQPGPVTVDELW